MANNDLQDFSKLSRSPIANHFRTGLASTGRPPLNSIRIFEPGALLGWIKSYLSYAFKKKHDFLDYDSAPNKTSVYQIPDQLKLSLAGDWGSGTEEAELIADQMMKWQDGSATDLTIHLGDVYYVGDEKELRENCLGGSGVENPNAEVTWPAGKLGSFALSGNHEMYANGNAYFDIFLPALGWRDQSGQMPGQGPSFFCLENQNWRIVGIDTGYNSVGIPIFGMIPGLGPDCKLEEKLINWLKTVVRPKENPKPTIILSHHQYLSAFEGDYLKPAEQLAEFFEQQTVLWLWGHEHRFSGYTKSDTGNFQFYGRCMGHGGMPIEVVAPNPESKHLSNLLFFDSRKNPQYQTDGIGFNGFAQLQFEGATLTINYYSLAEAGDNTYKDNPDLVLAEVFTATGADVVYCGISNNPGISGIVVNSV